MICESDVEIYMVSLDSTNEALFSKDTVAEIRQCRSQFAELFAHLLDHLLVTCYDFPALHDPVAAFFLIEPDAFQTKLIRVDVECNKNALNYAQTVCDFRGKTNKPKNVNVCYKTNVPRFWKRMLDIIREANKASPLK